MYTKNYKTLYSLIVLISLTIAAGVSLSARQAEAQSDPLIWLNPALASVIPGNSTTVVAQLDNASNIYGAELHLSYDPAVLAVVDDDAGKAGVQVAVGSCPEPGFIVINQADNAAGVIDYALTQLNPQLPCDGGDVAAIEFQCLVSDATSAITITSSVISDPAGSPIDHTVQHGMVECLSNVFSIEGSVALQGRADPEGTLVTLRDAQGNVTGQPVTVGPDGGFSFVAIVDTTYQVEASKPGFLSVSAGAIGGAVGDVIDLGLAVLPTGDLNGDGVINILDITAVAGNFGKSAPIIWGE